MNGWRLALLGVATVVAACVAPVPPPVAPSESKPPMVSAAPPDQTTESVQLDVAARVRQWCGSIGGCAYFASIDGPGGNWDVELNGGKNLLGSADLPAAVPPGRYTFTFRSAAVSDEVTNGQRHLGASDAECSTDLDIASGQSPQIVAVFALGSCEIATAT